MTVIEICRETDKKANYYIKANESQGLPVVLVRGIYYTGIMKDEVYNNNAVFKKLQNGLYVFKD